MKKLGKNILYLTIILLLIAIAILIGIIVNISNKNNTINKQEESQAEQLTETTSSNAYVDMATHLAEINSSTSSGMTYLQTARTSWNAGTTSGSKSYTIPEDGEYFFLIINSAYKSTTSANAKVTLNETSVELTHLFTQTPLYDAAFVYRTDVLSCSEGDVIKSVFKNASEPDWKAYTSIIIFKA